MARTPKWPIYAGAAGLVLGLVALFSGGRAEASPYKDDHPEDDEDNEVSVEDDDLPPPDPVEPEDERPPVPAELAEIDQMLVDEGVLNFSAKEFLTLRKWNKTVPVPDQYIPNLLAIARVAQLLRDRVGHPIQIANGYRPPDYNKAVGGANNSAHLRAAAVDLIVPEGYRTQETTRRFRVEAAKLWLELPDIIAGMGVYGGSRGRTHLDVLHPGGAGRRSWGSGPKASVIAEAKAELGL